MATVELTTSRVTGRRGKESTHERRYRISGASDSAIAMTALISAASGPVTVDGFELAYIEYDLDPLGANLWEGVASWSHKAAQRQETQAERLLEVDDSEFSFDFSGQSTHITEAISQTAYGTGAPDVGNSINVTQDGPQGVDIQIPRGIYTETKVFANNTVTQAWVATRAKMVGKVNNASFKGYNAGELLLTQFSGRKRGNSDWTITFSWAISENDSNLTVAGIPSISKNGWQYLWVMYEDAEDATAKRLKPVAVGVYVADVYKTADFSTLGV